MVNMTKEELEWWIRRSGGLLLTDAAVCAENAGRSEFTELVANHVLGDVHRDEGLAIVDGEVVADEVRVFMGLRSEPASATASILARSF